MMYAKLNIALVCYLTVILSASSFAQQSTNEIKAEPSGSINSKEQIQTENRDIWPIVKVDKVNNNSRTDVHVPIFFDMTSENGRNTSKLDLSVMHGLVTVNQDKEKGANGVSGPLTVTVFGIPVYTGRASARGGPVVEVREKPRTLEDIIQHPFADISNKTTPIMRELYINSRRANEKILRSFSDLFSRAAKRIEDSIETLSSGSGKPIDGDLAKNLVKSAKFEKEDLQLRGPDGLGNTPTLDVSARKVLDKAQI